MGKMKWLNIIKGNEEYYNALGLLEESPQIENHLFDMIESMICEPYEFPNESNVNDVRYENVEGRNFLNILKFYQQKTSYINMLNTSTSKHLFGRMR